MPRAGITTTPCLLMKPSAAYGLWQPPTFLSSGVKLSQLRPGFLAWLLNRPPSQHYFQREAEGTLTKSIRRSVLGATPVVLPPLDKQDTIINLANAINKKQQLMEQLIRNGETLMNGIANDLLTRTGSKCAMNDQINQDAINKAVWGACDSFRGVVDPSIYKDYVLTMLFLKYISDVWQDHYDTYQAEHGDEPELITELMKAERFVLPEEASFYSLFEHRHEPGNGERIDQALHAIEEANIAKLRDVFQDISFNSNKLGDDKQKNEILRHVLEDFNKPELNLRPSRIGTLDVIGNAYEYLIKNFAATSGKKAGEFYTPPEVSDLIAELLEPKEGDEICDPACGSGSLLMKCGRKIREKYNGSKKYALYRTGGHRLHLGAGQNEYVFARRRQPPHRMGRHISQPQTIE